MNNRRLEYLTQPEVADQLKRNPLVILPAGSVEQHGPHLPAGTDTFAANIIAERVAEKMDGKLDRMSVVYYRREGKWIASWKPGLSPKYPFVRASGGMISTVMDYAVFCQMYLNGGIYGGKRILKAETVKLITTSHTASLYSPAEQLKQSHYYGCLLYTSPSPRD